MFIFHFFTAHVARGPEPTALENFYAVQQDSHFRFGTEVISSFTLSLSVNPNVSPVFNNPTPSKSPSSHRKTDGISFFHVKIWSACPERICGETFSRSC
ncbi:hypothetical protein SLEP1_g55954 [Rubroshorea leprosula]|uniref:Secreted protein n=1 Tax=Rubroshorea leprosula TaxID=152421 RepID=A0AAV5MHE2_9ROSI|nr:hypothetical protein SLEP1_g55954 [Rubroshorea leprosula]